VTDLGCAALEAGSNYFTIYDRLDEKFDVTLTNPAKAAWLADHSLRPADEMIEYLVNKRFKPRGEAIDRR
jgi:hypothetical protein